MIILNINGIIREFENGDEYLSYLDSVINYWDTIENNISDNIRAGYSGLYIKLRTLYLQDHKIIFLEKNIQDNLVFVTFHNKAE